MWGIQFSSWIVEYQKAERLLNGLHVERGVVDEMKFHEYNMRARFSILDLTSRSIIVKAYERHPVYMCACGSIGLKNETVRM